VRARGEFLFSHRQGRVWFFGDAIDVHTPDALHAALAGISPRRGPAQDYSIAALRS
jgi:hypothetical protein